MNFDHTGDSVDIRIGMDLFDGGDLTDIQYGMDRPEPVDYGISGMDLEAGTSQSNLDDKLWNDRWPTQID
jgi:hypothetical protein